jgi:hypothetical protein
MTQADHITLRRVGVNTTVAAGSVLLALVGVAYLANIDASGIIGAILGVVLFVTGLVFAVRGSRAGVLVGATGLEIRGALRTRRLPWNQFRSAYPLSSTGPVPAVVLAIETVNGRVIRAEEVRDFGWVRRGRHPTVDHAVATIAAWQRQEATPPSTEVEDEPET